MNADKKKLYLISLILLAVLLGAFFIGLEISRLITALLLIPLTVLVCQLIRKRTSAEVQKKEVLLLCCVMAVLSVVAIELTGLHFSFYKNPYFVDLEILIQRVIPLALIIVTTEIIRSVLLAQKNKLVGVLVYLSCVVAEMLMLSNAAGISSFNRFMDLIGLTLFPAVSANIFYQYVSRRFGMLPNIAFRLITTLYIYFIPATTGMNDALRACIKIILPIGLLALTSALFEKRKKNALQKPHKLGVVGVALSIAVMASIAMLISCQFRFGALVIATESMTGEINKGDMIIYERYEGQPIEEGQVIVFLQEESKIVHRVVKIEHVNGETRYFTKGDANESLDAGSRCASDIVGLTDVKVAMVGYPTLWLRELFTNK